MRPIRRCLTRCLGSARRGSRAAKGVREGFAESETEQGEGNAHFAARLALEIRLVLLLDRAAGAEPAFDVLLAQRERSRGLGESGGRAHGRAHGASASLREDGERGERVAAGVATGSESDGEKRRPLGCVVTFSGVLASSLSCCDNGLASEGESGARKRIRATSKRCVNIFGHESDRHRLRSASRSVRSALTQSRAVSFSICCSKSPLRLFPFCAPSRFSSMSTSRSFPTLFASTSRHLSSRAGQTSAAEKASVPDSYFAVTTRIIQAAAFGAREPLEQGSGYLSRGFKPTKRRALVKKVGVQVDEERIQSRRPRSKPTTPQRRQFSTSALSHASTSALTQELASLSLEDRNRQTPSAADAALIDGAGDAALDTVDTDAAGESLEGGKEMVADVLGWREQEFDRYGSPEKYGTLKPGCWIESRRSVPSRCPSCRRMDC